jgi:hypothetical protein
MRSVVDAPDAFGGIYDLHEFLVCLAFVPGQSRAA